MSKKRYIDRSFEGSLVHLTEECAEVSQAACKTLRFGPHAYNPELPEGERELNIHALFREWEDAEDAMKRVYEAIKKEGL